MPTATLTFNLPEELEEYETVLKAGAVSSMLWCFTQEFLRGNIKYGLEDDFLMKIMQEMTVKPESRSFSEYERDIIISTLEAVRTKFYLLAREHDISDL